MVNVLFLIEHGKTEQTLRMNKTSTTIKVERKSLTVQTIRMSAQLDPTLMKDWLQAVSRNTSCGV
jgi:hypothetical protein